MKSKILGLLAVGLLAGPMAAQASLISSSTLSNVVIGPSIYNAVFWQDSSGVTLAAQVNTLPITFSDYGSAATAFSALQASLNASPGFDFSPANEVVFFYVVYAADVNFFSVAGGTLTAGPVDIRDSISGTGSFATFSLVGQAPEPGTLALLGLGLLGLGLTRRKAA